MHCVARPRIVPFSDGRTGNAEPFGSINITANRIRHYLRCVLKDIAPPSQLPEMIGRSNRRNGSEVADILSALFFTFAEAEAHRAWVDH